MYRVTAKRGIRLPFTFGPLFCHHPGVGAAPLLISSEPICFLNGCGPTKCATKQQMKCRYRLEQGTFSEQKVPFVIVISLNASHFVMVNTINKQQRINIFLGLKPIQQ